MKPYQRRQAAAYPYYKLAVWDARSLTFRDGKVAYRDAASAALDAAVPGRYRISVVTADGRRDLEPFEVG